MKLSLAWIFDHIVNPLSRYDVADIVDRFNKTTAEIESWQTITFNKESFAIGKVTFVDTEKVIVHCPEWHKDFELPSRLDAREGAFFVITQQKKICRWATNSDWHSSKEGLLAAVFVPEAQMRGSWKDTIATTDYILEVDNKSITHRPDLWGHHGFAREVAAMLGAQYYDEALLYQSLPVTYSTTKNKATASNPYGFEIQDTQKIKALAGMHIKFVTPQASTPWMMYRLCAIDARPINLLVDATNYTMYDIGQPLHAFDAQAISGDKIIARTAHSTESLTLLDGELIQLNTQDIIIADTQKPLSLAGIMGGKQSAVSASTNSMVIEAACFDATTIRQSVARHKKRTDAAARFEKTLDPHKVILALKRYTKILNLCGVTYEALSDITAVGYYPEDYTITLLHSFIESRLGIALEPKKISELLSPLGFMVKAKQYDTDTQYTVIIPTYRASKDVRIKEDLVEEIGRSLGYNALPESTPSIKVEISPLHQLYQQRVIKNFCKNALALQEVYTYALFDEQFLNQIQWHPEQSIKVLSPVSENRQKLVTSLIPQLLAVIGDNAPNHDILRFFELARIWHKDPVVSEKKSLAGIIYHKKNPLTFYNGKGALEQLFAELRMNVTWEKIDTPQEPWFIPYQSATIIHNHQVIGRAGLAHPLLFERVAPGSAFIFELNADILIAHNPETARMTPLAKFPDIVRDISMFVPLTVTVEALASAIKKADSRIITVTLQDFFEKAEWNTHRSLTFRYCIRDHEKTMTKYESDEIDQAVISHLTPYGVEIR